jgi:hypothetical protein
VALQDSALSAALKTIFDAMAAASASAPKDNRWYADQLAAAIDAQIKTAVVNTVVTIPSTSAPGTPSGGTGTGSLS